MLTGLRKNELASLTVAQLRLDGPIPHVELDAEDEKNREGNGVLCWGEGDSRQGRSVPFKREWCEGRPDGQASQAGFFARSGRHHAQVAVWMTASDKLSPVVNGARPTRVRRTPKARADGP